MNRERTYGLATRESRASTSRDGRVLERAAASLWLVVAAAPHGQKRGPERAREYVDPRVAAQRPASGTPSGSMSSYAAPFSSGSPEPSHSSHVDKQQVGKSLLGAGGDIEGVGEGGAAGGGQWGNSTVSAPRGRSGLAPFVVKREESARAVVVRGKEGKKGGTPWRALMQPPADSSPTTSSAARTSTLRSGRRRACPSRPASTSRWIPTQRWQ